MSVRHQHPAYGRTGDILNFLQMTLDHRARIEHGNLVTAEQVRVGTRTRHHRRIRGDQAAHTGHQLAEGRHLGTESGHGFAPG